MLKKENKNKSIKDPRTKPKGTLKKKAPKMKTHQNAYFSEPLGGIPIIIKTAFDKAGKQYEYRQIDPDFCPKIPSRAIRADLDKQYGSRPHLYYQNLTKSCIQCRNSFEFSALEQKYWYETLQFSVYSEAIRCPKCRKQKKTEDALSRELGRLKELLKKDSPDPYIMIEAASVICTRFELSQKGDLNEAISLSRKAYKNKKLPEGLFWEAMAQKLSNKPEKAKPLFEKFLELAGPNPALKRLKAKALAALND